MSTTAKIVSGPAPFAGKYTWASVTDPKRLIVNPTLVAAEKSILKIRRTQARYLYASDDISIGRGLPRALKTTLFRNSSDLAAPLSCCMLPAKDLHLKTSTEPCE